MNNLNTPRALGCVVGSAVGDALGAPFEFEPAGRYSAKYPIPVFGGTGEMTGSSMWSPGEATDDTQMAVIEAEILVRGGLDLPSMYEAFVAWADDPGTKDVGTTTSAVLRHEAGYPDASRLMFEATGKGEANGCIMRAAPAAVWLASHPDVDPDTASMELAAVTHGDPVAGWARVVLNRMLIEGIRGGDPLDTVDDALSVLPDDVVSRFGDMVGTDWAPGESDFNSLAWTCLAQAVWAVRTSETFHDAMVAAIDLGGDTDTVAAVAGGIAGARWSMVVMPSRWTGYLHVDMHTAHGTPRCDLEGLQDLAYRLMGVSDRPFDEPPVIGPTEITDGVHAASLSGAIAAPKDWAVVSMSRTRGRFSDRGLRRAAFLIDQEGRNDDIATVVKDVVDTIDAFVAEGTPVVVHCQTGNSRTGLALRAWLMRRNGWSDEQAFEFIGTRWEHVGLWNDDFTEFLRTEWAAGIERAS